MMSSHLRSKFGAALAALVLVATACAEGPTSPTAVSLNATSASTQDTLTTVGSPLLDDPTQWFRRTWLCKVGTNASFDVSVNGGMAVNHAIADGTCKLVSYNDGGIEDVDTVKVTELANAETVLDSIVVDSTHGTQKFRLPTIIGSPSVTTYTFRSKGAIVTFYNSPKPPPPPPPEGGQGCTPGYWKQLQHFDSWPAMYTPNQQFSSVFANAFPGKTLLQILGQGGGGLNALGRHTVAALLNSATSVDYDVATASVIAQFNAAYNNGDYEALKNVFAGFNEQGCPLN